MNGKLISRMNKVLKKVKVINTDDDIDRVSLSVQYRLRLIVLAVRFPAFVFLSLGPWVVSCLSTCPETAFTAIID